MILTGCRCLLNIRFVETYLTSIFKKWFKSIYQTLSKYLVILCDVSQLKGYDDRLIIDKNLYAIANSCHKLEYLGISDYKEISKIAIWNVIYSYPRI